MHAIRATVNIVVSLSLILSAGRPAFAAIGDSAGARFHAASDGPLLPRFEMPAEFSEDVRESLQSLTETAPWLTAENLPAVAQTLSEAGILDQFNRIDRADIGSRLAMLEQARQRFEEGIKLWIGQFYKRILRMADNDPGALQPAFEELRHFDEVYGPMLRQPWAQEMRKAQIEMQGAIEQARRGRKEALRAFIERQAALLDVGTVEEAGLIPISTLESANGTGLSRFEGSGELGNELQNYSIPSPAASTELQAAGEASPFKDRGFRALIYTEFLSVFNDNLMKGFIQFMMVATHNPILVAAAAGMFLFPYIPMSGLAGKLADRFSKTKIIRLMKISELAITGLNVVGIYTGNIPFVLATLILMGVHSSILGPAKYGLIPELVPGRGLSRANGIFEANGFVGIVAGTVLGSVIYLLSGSWLPWPHYVTALIFPVLALAGLFAGMRIPLTSAPKGEPVFSKSPAVWAPLAYGWNILKLMANPVKDFLEVRRADERIYPTLLGGAFFNFIGSLFLIAILNYPAALPWWVSHATYGLVNKSSWVPFMQVAASAGIGLGNYLAGRLSRGAVELGLVPIGALGIILFSVALALTTGTFGMTLLSLPATALLGVAAGFFILPLSTQLQDKTPADRRGRMLAAANFLFGIAGFSSAGLFMFLNGALGWSPEKIFWPIAAATLLFTLYLIRRLPESFSRSAAWIAAGLKSLRKSGPEHTG